MPRKTRLNTKPINQAAVAAAEKGVVILEGPHGLAVSMTPQAARQTGESLMAAATTADAQIESRARPKK